MTFPPEAILKNHHPPKRLAILFHSATLVGLLYIALHPANGYAAPFVEQVVPPVVQRGKTNRVELRGQQLKQSFDLWASLPGTRWTCRPLSTNDHTATFEVEVPADAPLGLYGLRAATHDGLSNVHLFLVDELPVQQLAPPSTLTPIQLPACIAAACREATIDRYSFAVVAGQQVSFEVVGNRFGKDYDPLLSLRNAAGVLLAQADNQPGLFFDCRFAHKFEQAGTYTIEVQDSRFSGDPTWHYVLRMGDFPACQVAIPSSVVPGKENVLRLPEANHAEVRLTTPATQPHEWFYQEVRLSDKQLATWVPLHADPQNHQLEKEPNATAATATQVTVPATLHGVLSTADDEDWFQLDLKKGQNITIRGEARQLGSPVDLELALLEPKGNEVRRVDDLVVRNRSESETYEARFDFTARLDGPHALLVRDLISTGNHSSTYRVEITESGPELTLQSEVARITLPRETYQPIPLKLTRTRFTGPVELELLGAPSGVHLEPTTIPADSTEIVCHLIAAADAPLGLSTLQIVARGTSGDIQISAVAQTLPLIDKRTRNKDLQVLALRDDQLYPPPSLTNRLALLVTPPSPFDVQLPTSTLVITKYLPSHFPISTTRRPGFASPITFDGQGGQIGAEEEERSNIFLRFPTAKADESQVQGNVFNRINTRYETCRVDLTATAMDKERQITLHRTFTLDTKPAFSPTVEPASTDTAPGTTVKVRLLAQRTGDYTGAVRMMTQAIPDLEFKEEIEIPAGQEEFELTIQVKPDARPQRYQIRWQSQGLVGKYEEEINGPIVTINVKLPPAPKK